MKRESKPILYRLIRDIIKFAMAIFFQKIEVRNDEFVPPTGPVVFVANHPNSIMDAMVMGVVTKRKVNYIGHAGLFSNKLKSWFLRSCGVIPVYRREDAPDKMDQNLAAFQACYEALEKGEAIGIFPEGTSDMLRRVKRVKTGAARIVLEAERRNNYGLGIQVVPIGLYFFSRSRFRSKVLVNIGRPLDLQPYIGLNRRDNMQAVQELTAQIQTRLERLTVNIRHEELDQFVRDLEKLYRDELKDEMRDLQKHAKSTLADFILTQKIAECVEYYNAREPQRVQDLQERIDAYKRKLKRLHLKDEMLKTRVSFKQLVWMSSTNMILALLGLPFALFGAVNNIVPYLISENIAKKFIDDRTKILSALLIGGGVAFIFFYTVQTILIGHFFGILWGTVYLLSLPATGLLALAYVKAIRMEQERINFSFFLFTNRQLFNKMRRERRRLILEMDAIKEEYLTRIKQSSEMKAT